MLPFDPNAAAGPDSGVFGLPFTPEQSEVVLLPIPFEATTSYGGGTADGPAAILAASRQVDLFDVETGRPYERGIAMLDAIPEIRALNDEARALAEPILAAGGAGDDPTLQASLATVNDRCARMNELVYREACRWLDAGKRVVGVGGDHSTVYGVIRAYAERHPGMGILHVDAHADLREAYEGFVWSHASIFHNVMTRLPGVARLVQVGIRDLGEAEHRFSEESEGRIVTHYDAVTRARMFAGDTWTALCREIVSALPPRVYVSFDIDGLDPTLCPHTGTPVPGGLSFSEATALIAEVVRSGRSIIGLDLNEVAPGPDSEWDGNVGARLLYKMIGWMQRR